jgi:hypothetical protein
MNAYSLLLAKTLLSIAVSLAVLYVLSPPLAKVLSRICPNDESATFWVSYTKIMLMIAPLLLVMTVDLLTLSGDPMKNLRLAIMAALGGMLIGLHSVGKRLGKFVNTPRQQDDAAEGRPHRLSNSFDMGAEK